MFPFVVLIFLFRFALTSRGATQWQPSLKSAGRRSLRCQMLLKIFVASFITGYEKCCVQRSWLVVCSGVYFTVNCLPSRALFYGVLLNQNQSNHNPSGKKKMSFRAKEIQSKIDQFCQSAGKQATKSWLVLVLHLNN